MLEFVNTKLTPNHVIWMNETKVIIRPKEDDMLAEYWDKEIPIVVDKTNTKK